ncbi:unnamed protein product [Symbiodinium natans]|uniref:Alpha-type protein kinase domain-containing protein n=1 Tax=Symbiodinium natans TaxID=878477 RepID=A0A812H2V7_9DINO|nr:unnamed protein product [Symbiodinium natans]
MGAALASCGLRLEHSASAIGVLFSGISDGDAEEELVLEVMSTAADDSSGVRPSGFKELQQLQVSRLSTEHGLEALSFRYSESVRSTWPDDYRFQASKRSWRASIASAPDKAYVLQMATRAEERVADAVKWDLEDAKSAGSYAHRFNLYSREQAREAGGPTDDQPPCVKVAAPVACRVVKTNFPALLPVGAYCTLWPYSDAEVRKFVFNGCQDFVELAQAFFHHSAFSSSGKELVCDIQGAEQEDGSLLLIDPCILRPGKVTVSALLKGSAKDDREREDLAACLGPVVNVAADKFDKLHPKCTQLCKAFDPQRSTVKRKVGVCGLDVTCGLARG